jgi:hypothetical protein
MNYLVSYNRSGNTWVRYILEYLTHQPTWGHEKFSISERLGQKSTITLTSNEPIVIKRHEIIPDEITENDKVIFLLRDYRECIWNSMNCKWKKFEPEFQKYWNLLKFFINFKGESLFIDYDYLMTNLKNSITKILNFLGFDIPDEINDFISNYEFHKEISFSIYKNSINTKNGEKIQLTDKELKYIYEIVSKYN